MDSPVQLNGGTRSWGKGNTSFVSRRISTQRRKGVKMGTLQMYGCRFGEVKDEERVTA